VGRIKNALTIDGRDLVVIETGNYFDGLEKSD
jgi:hypothetical protein